MIEPHTEYCALIPQQPKIQQRWTEDVEYILGNLAYSDRACWQFPIWVIWDLMNAPRSQICSPGRRFHDLDQQRKWSNWLINVWGATLAPPADHKYLPEQVMLLIERLAKSFGVHSDENRTSLPDKLNRDAKLADARKWWDFPGGGHLINAITNQTDVATLVGTSSMMEYAASTIRCDPFLHTWNSSYVQGDGVLETPALERGEESPEKADSLSGKFKRRISGKLPENPGRLDPLELLYMNAVPDLFMQRIAENNLLQRIYEQTKSGERVLHVKTGIKLTDSANLHKFSPQKPPPIHEFRRVLPEMLVCIANESVRNKIVIDVWLDYTDPLGNQFLMDLPAELMEHAFKKNRSAILMELARLVPSLFAHQPMMEVESPSPPEDSRKRYDASFLISMVDGQAPSSFTESIGDGSTNIECRFGADRRWRVKTYKDETSPPHTHQAAASRIAKAIICPGRATTEPTRTSELSWRIS